MPTAASLNSKVPASVLVLLALTTGLLSLAAFHGFQHGLNQQWFFSWNQASSHWPQVIWANLTLVADTLFAIAALVVVASIRPAQRSILLSQSLLLLIFGGLVLHAGKQYFDELRPAAVLAKDSFQLIGPKLKYESFPSGHSFTALSAATLIILSLGRLSLALPILLLALAAAFSRAAVGAHWPLDILVGSALGIVIAWGCFFYAQRSRFWNNKWVKFFALILLTLATAALAVHDSRYPNTQLLCVLASLTGLTALFRSYWTTLFSALRRA